jgi:hypothetical protein
MGRLGILTSSFTQGEVTLVCRKHEHQ